MPEEARAIFSPGILDPRAAKGPMPPSEHEKERLSAIIQELDDRFGAGLTAWPVSRGTSPTVAGLAIAARVVCRDERYDGGFSTDREGSSCCRQLG